MADDDAILPPPSPKHRRVATGQYERARQAAAAGHPDYAVRLLLTCCRLDPANLIYRRLLRQAQKAKYRNNLRGGPLAFLTTLPAKARLRAALRERDFLRALELGEEVLTRNPWDSAAQLDMAEAARALDLLDLAVWTLEEARQKDPHDRAVNRTLAVLYERRGNLGQAHELWTLLRQGAPWDREAAAKVQELEANAALARSRRQEFGQWGKGPEPAPAESHTADDPAATVATLAAQIERDLTDPQPYLRLARLHRQGGRLDEARAALSRGLGAVGQRFEMMTELADLEIEPFRQDLALVEARLASQPGDDGLLQLRARLGKEINTRELDLYRRRADHFPRDPSYRFELGRRLLRAGQIEEAVEELEQARGAPAHHWRAMLFLAHAHQSRHDWPRAERALEEALLHLPPGEEITRRELLFQLAQGAADAGDLAKAFDIGRGLAELDPGYRDIGRRLDEWRARPS